MVLEGSYTFGLTSYTFFLGSSTTGSSFLGGGGGSSFLTGSTTGAGLGS